MSARAIWKGVLRVGEYPVKVKFYSAVKDTHIRFRLLHARDQMPVRQQMINPKNKRVVPFEETRRAWNTKEGDLVILEKDELDAILPEASRDIEVLYFLPHGVIEPAWYDRPYYLGPDGDERRYFSLIEALAESGREGLVRWVMRNKEYIGALHLHSGWPSIITLRPVGEVVSAAALPAPTGRSLSSKELSMARQLMAMLESDFEPEQYRDEYRDRVEKMLDHKRKGGKVKTVKKRRKPVSDDLTAALEASLGKKTRQRA